MAAPSTFTINLTSAGTLVEKDCVIVGAAVTIAENGQSVQFGTDASGQASLFFSRNLSALAGVAYYVPLNIPIRAGESLYLQSLSTGSDATLIVNFK